MQIDTAVTGSFRKPKDDPGEVWLGLGIIKSWHDMGVGQVTCVSGCECPDGPHDFNAASNARVSVHRWTFMVVTEHKDCIIKVCTFQSIWIADLMLSVMINMLAFFELKLGS